MPPFKRRHGQGDRWLRRHRPIIPKMSTAHSRLRSRRLRSGKRRPDQKSDAGLRHLRQAFCEERQCHPVSHLVLGHEQDLEQAYVGRGRALDPSRYFIILVNQIGNGLSSSPHNTPRPLMPPLSHGYASATTPARSTSLSPRSSAFRSWNWFLAARWARSRPMTGLCASPMP